jgi:murein DD-endopeptidase MepM/ murein hydrolase activator NlpD
LHPPDELGRRGARGDGGPGDTGAPPGIGIRARGVALFVLGFLLGALALYYALWRTGGLKPGHFAARTTADLVGATRATTPAPLATIPFPDATPEGLALPAGPSTPTPGFGLGAGTTPGQLLAPNMTRTRTPAVRFFGTLEGRTLQMPVAGARTMDLRDNFEEPRGSRRHEAIDILAPRGTPVVAADEGRIAKLFTSKQGGLTVYQFNRDEKHAYYYAHLDRYAEGLKEGAYLRRGDPVGSVGTTGNAPPDTPHLHFGIFELGPEKKWWEGKPLNPYPFLMKVK